MQNMSPSGLNWECCCYVHPQNTNIFLFVWVFFIFLVFAVKWRLFPPQPSETTFLQYLVNISSVSTQIFYALIQSINR